MAAAIGTATHVSLHTDDPGETGENEVSGGSPAYDRVVISSWANVGDGILEATLAGDFDIPPNTEVTWAGLWDGTTFLDKATCFAASISQETVTITTLRFIVPIPDPTEPIGS